MDLSSRAFVVVAAFFERCDSQGPCDAERDSCPFMPILQTISDSGLPPYPIDVFYSAAVSMVCHERSTVTVTGNPVHTRAATTARCRGTDACCAIKMEDGTRLSDRACDLQLSLNRFRRLRK